MDRPGSDVILSGVLLLLLTVRQHSSAGGSTPCARHTLPVVSSCCPTVPSSPPPPLQAGSLPLFFKPCRGIIFFFLIFFFLSIIASQCYVGFCSTMKWINYMYTYIPSFLDLPPSPPSHPQIITEPRAELPVLYSSFPLAVSFTQGSVYVTPDSSQASHPQPYPMSACPCICICTSTYASLFLPWNEAHLYNSSRFHIHALIYDICFSLSDLFHSI